MNATKDVVRALTTDAEEVDRMVAGLEADRWELPTPAPGWNIRHQIAHLAFVFRIAGLAASDPAGFTALTSRMAGGFDTAVNAALQDYADDPPELLLHRWRTERDTAIKALAEVPAGQLVPWLVNPLPAPVLGCAGMMELFGHGQDIADALGIRRTHTDRIEHVADFAVRTREFGYEARDLTPPAVRFRFELTAPSGRNWTFGPEDAEQSISGPATDFCLLVTRRRHRDDLALTATGSAAEHWLTIAQAYRGTAGPGRSPGQFDGR